MKPEILSNRRIVTIVSAAAFILSIPGTGAAQSQSTPMMQMPMMQMQTCSMQRNPVCAEKSGMKQTYANAGCAAMDGAKNMKSGECKMRGMSKGKMGSR